MTRTLDIQGHRGARALFAENTLEGFRAAAALGVTTFELDVALTADGVAVVSHDPTLNPDIVRDSSGVWLSARGPTIHSLTHAQMVRYDVGRLRPGSPTASLFPDQQSFDGARIPTLAAVLAALPTARFTIEVKTDPAHPDWTAAPDMMADATLAVIDAAAATHRVVVEAFDWRVQRHIRRIRSDIRLAWLTRPGTVADAPLWWDDTPVPASVPAAVAAEGGPIWAPDHTTLTQPLIEEAHRLGLVVWPWTVNEARDIRRLIEWRVDGVISDWPDRVMMLSA